MDFYVEAFGTDSANSGWFSPVSNPACWQPGQLDGKYGAYQWHVKARDNYSAESNWSPAWNFTIQPPNYPPSIFLNTANGSTAATIESNNPNWTFAGTASDPEGQLNRIEFQCGNPCDNKGIGSDQTTGNNWSLTRIAIAGKNDIYFVAYDDEGGSTASRHLDLRIDMAAPITTLSLNNESESANWPIWFTDPVQVGLHAVDSATYSARSGVYEVCYRIDGGNWQTPCQSGSEVTFVVSSDGLHSMEYYSIDKVGNQETSPPPVNFKIDQTPPDLPSGINETHGAINNQWQKDVNTPTFTWEPSSDATSGIWGYQFYFGSDPNGVSYQTFLAGDPRQWTPQPGGIGTDIYYLRGRTRDNAGNWSAWTTLFTLRYDGTPPENPGGITHTSVITNNTWQRITNLPDFTWPVPHDEGSGIKGYLLYWGLDPAGIGTDFINTNSFQFNTPVCGLNEACTGYLRLRSIDNVDHQAEEWTTGFVLRYDNAPPIADFTFNGGVTQTTQTLLTLNINAIDEGSGLRATLCVTMTETIPAYNLL